MAKKDRGALHRNLYILGLTLFACGLPFSVVAISVSQFILVINTILEGDFTTKWQRLKQNKAAIILMSLFLLHILGLIYTENFNYAFKDLRIKLPILLLPLVVGSSVPLSKKEFQFILKLFIASVFTATLFSIMAYLGLGGTRVDDTRQISLFVSHIRFSLMLCMAMVILLNNLFYEQNNRFWKSIYVLLLFWGIIFLILLESLTGLAICLVLAFFISFYFGFLEKNPYFYEASFAMLALALVFFSYLGHQVYSFYQIEPFNEFNAKKQSASGEIYQHLTDRKQVENGIYVWNFIAWNELKQTWNSRSKIHFDSTDNKNQQIQSTIIRYLTSKNLNKDKEGVLALSEADVEAIESGYANVKILNGRDLNFRIYETIWEVHNYLFDSHIPAGNSLTQRFVYWQTGFSFYKNHILLGVGTGDIKDAFDEAHEVLNPYFKPEYRNRAHNQYLTILFTFGLFGFIWFVFVVVSPYLIKSFSLHFLFHGFFIIMCMSMINEDTLESQAGVSFVMLFFVLTWFAEEGRKVNLSS